MLEGLVQAGVLKTAEGRWTDCTTVCNPHCRDLGFFRAGALHSVQGKPRANRDDLELITPSHFPGEALGNLSSDERRASNLALREGLSLLSIKQKHVATNTSSLHSCSGVNWAL